MSAPSLVADFKRVTKLAAKWGMALAFVCHWFPDHYRPICDAIDQISRACTGGI